MNTSRINLTGKNIILTGAAGILGEQYTEDLIKAGARVFVSDIDSDKVNKICMRLKSELAIPSPVDLTSEESVNVWADKIIKSSGHVTTLINNAATKSPNFFNEIGDYPLADWKHVVDVNITAMFLTSRKIIPHMIEHKNGNIINVSSIYGIVGPDQRIYEGSYYEDMGGKINTPMVYSVTKGAVVSLTKYIATTYGEFGIRSNTLTPGGVASGQNQKFNENYSNRVPLRRMGSKEDMSDSLLYLCSDMTKYISGQNIVVDGGLTAW